MGYDTLNELIEALNELADMETEDGTSVGDLPVGVAYQQSWPLSGYVAAVTVATRDSSVGPCVWIAESRSDFGPFGSGYAPRDAWEGGIEGVDFFTDDEC